MRDAYHEELDALSDSLVEMTRLVRVGDQPGVHRAARTPT